MSKQNAVKKKGFTLMELLIVVVIIGLLTSIALPMYKKAVERSRASEALSNMQAVAQSEHNWYLVKNNYTKDFSKLDIDLSGEMNDEKLKTTFYDYELLDTGILASRNNGEYALYKDYEIGQIMCSPSEHYICENLGKLTKEPCQKVGLFWANRNSTCYGTDKARCKGLYGDGMWNGEFCGYTNTSGQTLDEGMECLANKIGQCSNSTVNDGGICRSIKNYGCGGSTVTAGGICLGKDWDSCKNSYIDGGTCIANSHNGCQYSTITAGGICIANTNDNACSNVTLSEGGTCKVSPNAGGGSVICDHTIINSGGVCDSTEADGCGNAEINKGGVCNGRCTASTVNEGGICNGTANGSNKWPYAGGCRSVTVNSGGICKGSGVNSCRSATINEGGECWAENTGACGSSAYGNSTYEGTGKTSGCCRGKYCPSGSPRCECTNHETACDDAPTL